MELEREQYSDIDQFDVSVKSWVANFLEIILYQTKDITPYIHAFSMHVSQFLRLYGNNYSTIYIEKLNDRTTRYFHSSSNHVSLKKNLQKQNHLEALEGCANQQKKKCKNVAFANLLGITNTLVKRRFNIHT